MKDNTECNMIVRVNMIYYFNTYHLLEELAFVEMMLFRVFM